MGLLSHNHRLLFLALLVQLSAMVFPMHSDEGVFLTMGYAITQGKTPYVEYFDHKPPAIYAIAALFTRVMGHSWWWPRVLMAGVNVGSAYLLYLCGRQICPKRSQAFMMGTTYLLLLPLIHGQFFGLEPWINLWLLAAAYGWLRWREGQNWRLLAAGFFLGIASLFKQSAWLVWPVFGWWGWQRRREHVFLMMGGAGIVLAVVGAYYGYRHQLPALWAAVIGFNLHYYPPQPLAQVVTQQGLIAVPFLPLLVAGLLRKKRAFAPQRWWPYLWLSFIPTLFLRGYHHYWIPLLPLICWWVVMTVKRNWLHNVLYIYLSGIGVFFILYCWLRAYPALRYQLELWSPTDCINPPHPAVYFLHRCLPREYYFYQSPSV